MKKKSIYNIQLLLALFSSSIAFSQQNFNLKQKKIEVYSTVKATKERLSKSNQKYSLLKVKIITGRTHQIRVHMASIGHPLLGDAVYGPKKCPVKNLQGQTLHAMVLGFIHPRTGAYMEFEAPLPEYFSNLLLQFRKNV